MSDISLAVGDEVRRMTYVPVGEGAAMSDAAAKSIVASFNDCIGRRDITGLSSLMTDDHVFIDTANN
jgi:hypothetical protein